ncbi:MAG TPA: hypothetical protein VG186_09200 [Solirubrobacteraceae bacterium]|jgi:membrane protein implicated in regulation of membrane protease activity|nr:hypothetical protein [Solirubrobacteraceae bacterium]
MPDALLPWAFPLALVAAVILTALSITIAAVALSLLAVVALGVWRARYLKKHPPEAELSNRPFWKF